MLRKQLQKIGNSLGVVIGSEMLRELDLGEEDEFAVTTHDTDDGDKVIVLAPVRRRAPVWRPARAIKG